MSTPEKEKLIAALMCGLGLDITLPSGSAVEVFMEIRTGQSMALRMVAKTDTVTEQDKDDIDSFVRGLFGVEEKDGKRHDSLESAMAHIAMRSAEVSRN